MTNPVPDAFVVPELTGRFVPSFLDEPVDLDWIPEDDDFRLQLNGPNGFSVEVPVSANGTFHVPGLRDGRYCFRTSSHQFQGYEGVIVIDRKATAEAVVILVDLGA